MFYVYSIIDPRTKTPFYIGKGKDNRMYMHERYVINGRIPDNNKHKYYKIKQILDAGLDLQYEIFWSGIDEDKAFTIEKQWIQKIGLDNLVNITNGGQGGCLGDEVNRRRSNSLMGHKISPETIEKIKQGNLGKVPWNKGLTLSDEQKRNFCNNRPDFSGKNNPMYGKTHSDETRRKLRKAWQHRLQRNLSAKDDGSGDK